MHETKEKKAVFVHNHRSDGIVSSYGHVWGQGEGERAEQYIT
jgi:hypothetical protein